MEEGATEEDDDWKEGHPIMSPNILLVGDEVKSTFQFRVPADDDHTYHVSYYTWGAAPGTTAPKQERVPYRYVPLTDEDGRYIVDILFNQDYMAWVTQGDIARRDLEKLGESDVGIIMYRKLLQRQMALVADGGDPMCTFRDPAENQSIELPLEHVKFANSFTGGYRLVEAGGPLDVDLIEATMKTWDGVRSGRATAGARTS